VARIGELMKEGKLTNIIAVPTSIATKNQAEGAAPDLPCGNAQIKKERAFGVVR
jgi:hypothetical protein